MGGQLMRRIEKTTRFKRAMRRVEMSGRYTRAIKDRLMPALRCLAQDIPLDYSYYDHPLHGDMEGFRECHIKPDLLLVYRYEGDDVLWLERLGSHAELFGM